MKLLNFRTLLTGFQSWTFLYCSFCELIDKIALARTSHTHDEDHLRRIGALEMHLKVKKGRFGYMGVEDLIKSRTGWLKYTRVSGNYNLTNRNIKAAEP